MSGSLRSRAPTGREVRSRGGTPHLPMEPPTMKRACRLSKCHPLVILATNCSLWSLMLERVSQYSQKTVLTSAPRSLGVGVRLLWWRRRSGWHHHLHRQTAVQPAWLPCLRLQQGPHDMMIGDIIALVCICSLTSKLSFFLLPSSSHHTRNKITHQIFIDQFKQIQYRNNGHPPL